MTIEEFHCAVDQLVALVMLNCAVALLADYLLTAAPRSFDIGGLRAGGFGIAIDLLAAYLVARALRRSSVAIPLLVILFSVGPVARVGSAIVESTPYADPETLRLLPLYLALGTAFTLWAFVLAYRAIRLVAVDDTRRMRIAYFLYLAVLLIPSFLPRERLWQTREDDEAVASVEDDDPPGVTWEEGETVLDAQPRLIRDQDSKLLPERKGIVDLYFVGFASYADQDVFFKEITYARDLFDRRFDTRGRSVLLVNHPRTKRTLPVASVTNLRATLRDLGGTMNRAEDILFLFLASHGERDHTLSVKNGYLPLRDLSPGMLADALRRAGIVWRVIVADACYSGGFVEPLEDERTMIITSASSSHTSYGCGDEAEMTYFGNAFLRHGLSHGYSFAESFGEAASLIRRWETAERRSHSEPQIFIGSAIADRVKALDERLRRNGTAGRSP